MFTLLRCSSGLAVFSTGLSLAPHVLVRCCDGWLAVNPTGVSNLITLDPNLMIKALDHS
jgi:hypothetical protein